MPDDVLIVGAGPAGTTAALVLARAGVNVTLLDRASFPRDKLCGDSVNPGTMALLGRLGVAADIEARGLPVEGMLVTGPGGAAVTGTYPGGLVGRSIRRCDLDVILLDAAIAAGARFEDGVRVAGPIADAAGSTTRVTGVRVAGGAGERRAAIVIAADGRRSTLAFGLGLARPPRWPRRWAIGAYYAGVEGLGPRGEMHVRRQGYVGVAPVPGGMANVCLVIPEARARRAVAAAGVALDAAIVADDGLRQRFRRARRLTPVSILGPLAVDATGAGVPGLLLAGDAAGFVDPMTGDGLRFAVRGGALAAEVALEALTPGRRLEEAPRQLARRRGLEFQRKRRSNCLLRTLVGVPTAVSAATLGGRMFPSIVEWLVAYAGDVSLAASDATS
jgi:flavin-dependent dehydrogenase